jgi:hypothetical protein
MLDSPSHQGGAFSFIQILLPGVSILENSWDATEKIPSIPDLDHTSVGKMSADFINAALLIFQVRRRLF